MAAAALEGETGSPVPCSHAKERIWLTARSSPGQTDADWLPHKHHTDESHHHTRLLKQSLFTTTKKQKNPKPIIHTFTSREPQQQDA